MAPGPMGQCFPIPDDEDVKRQMITTAENQRKIYRMFNFDYVTKVHMHCVSLGCMSCSCIWTVVAMQLQVLITLLSHHTLGTAV